MHETVLSASQQKEDGVKAIDIAKKLLDEGFHAPTMYFPLIVDEALMIEPTESESKETIDRFIDAMIMISELSKSNPKEIIDAPVNLPVERLDEAQAARNPVLIWAKKVKIIIGSDHLGINFPEKLQDMFPDANIVKAFTEEEQLKHIKKALLYILGSHPKRNNFQR